MEESTMAKRPIYNEEQKLRFIEERDPKFTSTKLTQAYSMFRTFAPFETEWGEDMCFRSTADIQDVINKELL